MRKTFEKAGTSAEEKALDSFAQLMIDKISSLKASDQWHQPWFTDKGLAWPKNLSGREYNGMNAVMLKMIAEKNQYELPVWSTFNRLTSLNYEKGNLNPLKDKDGNQLPRVTINKGEKSSAVFITTFTVINKDTREKIPYEDYRQLDPDEQKKFNVFPHLNVYNVFNIGQSNLKEARPELYAKLVAENQMVKPQQGEHFSLPELDVMIKEQKWICPIRVEHQDKAYYNISRNEILMPEASQFKDGESFVGNTFHEMSHSTGSANYLNRFDPSKGMDNQGYAREELIAELSAAVECSRFGITKHLKSDSATYIKSWLDNLNESPQFIKTVLCDVKKASSILDQKLNEMTQTLADRQNVSAIQTQSLDAQRQGPLKNLGTYDIPEWSLNYLENGDATNLSDEEVEMVDKFVKEKFPQGYLMNVDWNNSKEFDQQPAFGERNPNALTNRGESPYLATKTYAVQFLHPTLRENEEVKRQETQKTEQPHDVQEEQAAKRSFRR